jgi:predicted transglutaminase-like cysteine proteinase
MADGFLKELNYKFRYIKDSDQYGKRDAWYIMKRPDEDGWYRGDCEDYSLTLLYNLKGRSVRKLLLSLLIRESKICFCKVNGVGHAVLYYKGQYIDNICQKWVSKEYLEQDDYEFSFWIYIPYQVIIKLVMGYFITK